MIEAPLRFLVVEDEVILDRCLAMELEEFGFTVCGRVARGEEAVAAAVREHPDVILMDIRLAGEPDGVETARRILSIEPIPIIFMTGYSDGEAVDRARGLNPLGCVFKPIRIEKILAILAADPFLGLRI